MIIQRMPHAIWRNVVLLFSVLVLLNLPAYAQVNPLTTRTLPSPSTDNGSGDNPQAAKDRLFLHDAVEDSLMESQLSQLALQKSSNEDIKKFAQTVVDDNVALMNSLEPLSKSLGVKPPKKPSKGEEAEYAKLNAVSGVDFDKAYLARIAKEDHKNLDEFQQEAALAGNPNLKDAAAKGARMIQERTVSIGQLVQAGGAAPAH